MIQRAIYNAYRRQRRVGLGAVDTQGVYEDVTLSDGRVYRRVRPEMRSLVVNAISNNWKHVRTTGGTGVFDFSPGATDAGTALEKALADGMSIVFRGDPFGIQNQTFVLAPAPTTENAIFSIALDPSSGMLPAVQDGVLLAESESDDGPLDTVQTELKRAELGLRWGSIAGAAIGIGIIAAVELKRRGR